MAAAGPADDGAAGVRARAAAPALDDAARQHAGRVLLRRHQRAEPARGGVRGGAHGEGGGDWGGELDPDVYVVGVPFPAL